MQPASFSSRFAAMNLDMLIYTAIVQGLGMVIEQNAPDLATLGNISIISFVISILYFVVPTKTSGQTLGKKLLLLKVVPQQNERAPVSWGQSFLREVVGKTLSTIPFFLGYLWAKFSPDRKAWHDSISRTQVISLVVEEEKTSLQRFQQIMLGILSIPLGVALILGAFLYTSLPLDSIKEKIEAAGIQVGALTGSLAGGMHFSEIRRHDKEQSYSLGSVDVKFNLSELVYDRHFTIEKLTAEEGHFDVPADFSWATVFFNIMAIGQSADNGGISIGNFRMGKLHLKNIFFEHDKKVISKLQEFSVKNLEMADKELHIGEAQFQIPGFTLKTQDLKSAFGRIEVASATGGMGPEFLPLLKVPVDFHFKGAIGKNPKTTKIDGGMTIDKIKFSYEAGKILVTVDKLLLNEMFKTSMPLEDLDMKVSAGGDNALELMSSLTVDYAIKICGNEFKADPEKGPFLDRADRHFQFKMTPKPVENFSNTIFAKEATLDDLFLYELHGKKQIAPDFASHQEMAADLCFQKPIANLQPQEIESLKPLVAASENTISGASLQALLSKAVPITVSSTAAKPAAAVAAATPAPTLAATPAPSVTPTVAPAPTTAAAAASPAVSPAISPAASPALTVELAKVAIGEARNLLRAGKYAEAKTILEGLPASQELFPTNAELGAYYNLKAWVYLYSSEPSEAAQAFERAFTERKEIGDAEGLLRANEELKNSAEAQKWLEYLKAAVKDHPELKNRLTPNMQKRLAPSEAAAESHP